MSLHLWPWASTIVNKVHTQNSYEKKVDELRSADLKAGYGDHFKRPSSSVLRWSPLVGLTSVILKPLPISFSIAGINIPASSPPNPAPTDSTVTAECSGRVPKSGARIRILALSFPYPKTWQVNWHYCASISSNCRTEIKINNNVHLRALSWRIN